ncbi:hypothetical protein DYB31_008915 [Aphanomyces astaci]|uniref:ERAP1-like C-terminal domain-containing protein n=1 Tax=Aphanomyces astaci TaxID=112090 RepID=A0A397FLG8_APHAT|nr:hypothetical protein DYB31_008915 [Aphanomyces astaci]
MNFWVHTLKLFLFPLKAKSWTLGSLELAASHRSRRPNKTSDGKYRRRLYVVMGQFTWDARPTDQDLTSNFRCDVIAMLAAANDPAVAAEASARFHAAVSARVFGSVAADGSTVAWEYVQAKWDALNAQYSQIVVGRLLWVSIANFQTEQVAAAVEAFLVGRPQEGAFAHPLASFLENIGTGTAM